MKKKVIEYEEKRWIKYFIITLITILFGGVLYYFMLPPINPSSFSFWLFLILVVGVYTLIAACSNLKLEGNILVNKIPKQNDKFKRVWICIGVILLAIIFINLINSPIFNAKSYHNRIYINENGDFSKDIPVADISTLPLIDKDSSSKLGDRVMGQMTDLVSQFEVSDLYTQINYNNDIVRVTPLEYAGLIKYIANHTYGVPGYIKVNSVTGSSELVRLDKGMKYMPSAILNENLYRKLRFTYLTDIFGEANFEIDNDGNPYWIIPTLKYTGVGLKEEVSGVIILDPITGSSTKYSVNDVPKWVDHVYSADLVIDQINDWGTYKNGFLNSLFSQKGVVNTTDGYNYTVIDDDVYLYTGITSVLSDESNIGFILCNLRTKETIFYNVSGAEEYSAMDSAEGQVQQMNYKASFPLLINLNNKPTYLLSLKDNAELVKMYALVDVTNYQRVVVTDSSLGIERAISNYLGSDIQSGVTNNKDIVLNKIYTVSIDGNTYYYLLDMDNNKYKVSIKVSPNVLPFIEEGSKLSVIYIENKDINEITEIK
ncbi:MAG: CvpA family protein [Clostridium sp.]|nr:CvpA family protein [Clostridium sp.]MCM1444766.1 hypothetical protein [Candidatus Amulumruptor caecigallinarius]